LFSVGVGGGLPAHFGGKVWLLSGGAPCPLLWLPTLWAGVLAGLGLLLRLALCAFVLATSACKPGWAVPV